ncbi:hypothetical protein GCM10010191_27750 [Actinomadura vinacea]|uniref:Uncharacterized protein n=1 Tax=Actinomadura vinacea TaxID=115336 RepID=A0ABP5W0T2_9ACTN
MTNASPRHGRGKHSKPPSEFSVRWNRLIRSSLTKSGRRRLVAAGTGTATVALIAVAAAAGFAATGEAKKGPQAAVAAQKARPSAAASPQATDPAGGPDETVDVMPYLQTKDPEKKVSKYVKDVQRTGDFLRVYTDLEEGDENSKPAVSLCEWTTEFLRGGGDKEPRVFVHGKSEDNGSVVLANKQSDKDDCEVGETR